MASNLPIRALFSQVFCLKLRLKPGQTKTVFWRVYLIKTTYKILEVMRSVWVPLLLKGVAIHLHHTSHSVLWTIQRLKSVIAIMDPPSGHINKARQSRTFPPKTPGFNLNPASWTTPPYNRPMKRPPPSIGPATKLHVYYPCKPTPPPWPQTKEPSRVLPLMIRQKRLGFAIKLTDR